MTTTTPTIAKDKTERKLKQTKIKLMRNPKFALWSGILMVGKTMLVEDLPTAATNGRDEFYGRKFVEQLSDKELAFVVLHENLHKALRHMTTWKKIAMENMQLANMAMDYVINLMLVDMDPQEQWLAAPKKFPICLDKKYAGMHTKQVYDLLKQDAKKNGSGGKCDCKPGECKGSASAKASAGQATGQCQASGNFDEHDWSGAGELSDQERKTLEREIDQALRQGKIAASKLHGDGAGNMSRELGELMEPQIDWKEVNRRFISSGVYMPSLIGETVGKLVIGIDASGSTWGGNTLNNFLSEVKSIAEDVHPECVELLYWDTAIAGHETYQLADMETLVANTTLRGGGGTAPQCVVDYMAKHNIEAEAIIMITDGYVPNYGSGWTAPVLWVIAGNEMAEASNGKTIHIKDE